MKVGLFAVARYATLKMLLLGAVLALGVTAASLPTEQAAARYGPRAVALFREWGTLLASLQSSDERIKLREVNQFFNRRIQFRSDAEVWSTEDYWATPLEMFAKGSGDCEDYSIGKYVSLMVLGVSHDKLRMTYVRARLGGPSSTVTQAHMVLAYYPTPDTEPMILDNLVSSILPASQRTDLQPVFSFNAEGLWIGGASSNVDRLTRWRQVLDKLKSDGFTF